mgnify:CR=1 FL=1
MEGFVFWKFDRVPSEHAYEGAGGVISVALQADLAIGVIKESEHIQGAFADVFEFFEALFHVVGLKIGREALEDLDSRTLIKEEQAARWVSIEGNEVLHFGEEVWIGDVKEVAGPVRFESIALQNAMQRGLAGRHVDHRWVCQQMTCGPSQRPSPAVGQRLNLAVKRNNT